MLHDISTNEFVTYTCVGTYMYIHSVKVNRWLIGVTLVVGSFCPKILGPWWGPMKTFCSSVNADGMGIVLVDGGDTSTLHVITKLVQPFSTEPLWGAKN